MKAAHIWIVSPALAKANNGNWQTAARWARFLRGRYRVTLAQHWPDGAAPDGGGATDGGEAADGGDSEATDGGEAADGGGGATDAPALLIALHARRSAPSLAAFIRAYPDRPTILALTGTDLYRDIQTDRDAQEALRQAGALVVLQSAGLSELAPDLRAKARVIYQSARTLRAAPVRPRRFLDVTMIGHLRDEKDPATFMRASALVSNARVRMIHIGGALETPLGELAAATQAAEARYRWLGPLSHAATRQRLRRSHLMVLASRMEGGANVIIEAVTSGVPVLASDISGNRGMLGDDYAGFFALGDAAALARLIERACADAPFHARLQAQCAARAPLFAPQAEQTALLQLVDNLLQSNF